MSQYILNCDAATKSAEGSCTMVPWSQPPATIEHYAIGPTWGLWLVAGILIVAIVASAIVRVNTINQRAETEQWRIKNPQPQCHVCGAKP